jgi:hypothetical protein
MAERGPDPKRKLIDEALQLPLEARAALAGILIESLDAHVDGDAEATWAREIERRLGELDQGVVRSVPWSQARRAILGAG